MLEGASVFSSARAYWVNGKQVAHFIDGDRIELRLTKPVIRELRSALKADERVALKSASDVSAEVLALRVPADAALPDLNAATWSSAED